MLDKLTVRVRTRQGADAYAEAFAAHVAAQPHGMRPVLLADHRPIVVYPQPAADRLIELFVKMNKLIERVAIVVATAGIAINAKQRR